MFLAKRVVPRLLPSAARRSLPSVLVSPVSKLEDGSSWQSSPASTTGTTCTTVVQASRHFCCTASTNVDMQEEDPYQEPRVSDHFELFGIPRRYALDQKELQQSYRNLMAKYHPDRRNQQAMGHNDEDDDGDMDASQITNAYQILREPHTRATYLLELLGHPIEETANTASLIRPEFLLQVMEWRETIDSLDPSSGDHDDMEVLEDLLSQTKDEIQGVMSQLDEAFQKQDLNRAMQLSAQLQYWHRIEETIQDKM